MKAAIAVVVVRVLLGPTLARADGDPCASALVDPAVTTVRDADLDAQRSACPRQDISIRVRSYALIDTPGFHGDLGGELIVGGRLTVSDDYELSAQLHLIDYAFVQNAVNQVTNTAFGPIVVGGARSVALGDRTRGALAAQLELPYTADPMDTFHISGALGAVVTHGIAPAVTVHGRLGALAMHAASLAGSTGRVAIRGGADVAWRLCSCLVVQAGTDVSTGWYGGFDHMLLRAGVHWKMSRRDWRLRAGLGAPVFGDERTNAVLDIAVVHGL